MKVWVVIDWEGMWDLPTARKTKRECWNEFVYSHTNYYGESFEDAEKRLTELMCRPVKMELRRIK